jgi:S-adenosylmethionine hydrolase
VLENGVRTRVSGPIALLTDFGLDDAYVGVMKGVILSINPQAVVVDLCHQVAPQDVAAGAFLLATSYRYFPPTTIFVAVVDPGVGGARRAIALRTPHGTFVGPDNGLFGLVLADFGISAGAGTDRAILSGSEVAGVILANPHYFQPRVSSTFHGRDIFAPVAAHLSLGVPLSALGPVLTDVVVMAPLRPCRRGLELVGHVVYIDHFGNAITDVTVQDLEGTDHLEIVVAGHHIRGLSRCYADRAGLLALIGSLDRLEIAVAGGSAAQLLGLRPGDEVIVRTGERA